MATRTSNTAHPEMAENRGVGLPVGSGQAGKMDKRTGRTLQIRQAVWLLLLFMVLLPFFTEPPQLSQVALSPP